MEPVVATTDLPQVPIGQPQDISTTTVSLSTTQVLPTELVTESLVESEPRGSGSGLRVSDDNESEGKGARKGKGKEKGKRMGKKGKAATDFLIAAAGSSAASSPDGQVLAAIGGIFLLCSTVLAARRIYKRRRQWVPLQSGPTTTDDAGFEYQPTTHLLLNSAQVHFDYR